MEKLIDGMGSSGKPVVAALGYALGGAIVVMRRCNHFDIPRLGFGATGELTLVAVGLVQDSASGYLGLDDA